MRFLLEMLPVLIFFAANYLYTSLPASIIEMVNSISPYAFTHGEKADAIFFATLVAILIAGITFIIGCLQQGKLDKKLGIMFILFIILGGATLAFGDEAFIKWKPTVLYLVFAAAFLVSMFIGKKSLTERMLGNAIEAPQAVWVKLNWAWIGFFVLMAVLNLYIAYTFSNDTWVNFKSFGSIGLMVIFLVIQMVILNRYIIVKSEE